MRKAPTEFAGRIDFLSVLDSITSAARYAAFYLHEFSALLVGAGTGGPWVRLGKISDGCTKLTFMKYSRNRENRCRVEKSEAGLVRYRGF